MTATSDATVPDAAPAAQPGGEASALAHLRDVAITHEGEDVATPASVTFDVRRGDVVLLLGPSGSGKSTLTLALNGLIPHAVPATVTGDVRIAGHPTIERSVAQLSTHVGMVFQDPDAQLVTGTVLDEVAFGPENLTLPVEEVLARSEAALRRVGLWERRSENPDRLSGGGRQRLAIACALAMGAPILVLDEPTANLDPQGIEDVYAALADVVSSRDRAIVLVEHNLDAAVSFVGRVVVLDQQGVVVADGGVDAVLRERAAELHAMGVWLPTSAIAALRLRDAGYRLEPLPLTPDELRRALDAEPSFTAAASPELETRKDRPAEYSGAASVLPSAQSPQLGATPDPQLGAPRDGKPGEIHDPQLAQAPVRIEVRGLTLRRHKRAVLQDVSLDVRSGEFVAIIGPNGAGKTSLIQAVAGVITPPRGTVFLGGQDVARLDDRQLAAQIGFVFQNPEHQFISGSVYDEIAHGLRRQGLGDDETRERTLALLRRFGLEERAHVHPFLLSGGQKRRLSVGTALVAGAPVLALDEPTFGQDRARADELLGLLRDLNDDGTTVLVVTHDMQLVADYADRVIVLADGAVIADGAPGAVLTDEPLLARAGLRMPPLARALATLTSHPELHRVTRVADLPGSPS